MGRGRTTRNVKSHIYDMDDLITDFLSHPQAGRLDASWYRGYNPRLLTLIFGG